jgi:hypothetical protein
MSFYRNKILKNLCNSWCWGFYQECQPGNWPKMKARGNIQAMFIVLGENQYIWTRLGGIFSSGYCLASQWKVIPWAHEIPTQSRPVHLCCVGSSCLPSRRRSVHQTCDTGTTTGHHMHMNCTNMWIPFCSSNLWHWHNHRPSHAHELHQHVNSLLLIKPVTLAQPQAIACTWTAPTCEFPSVHQTCDTGTTTGHRMHMNCTNMWIPFCSSNLWHWHNNRPSHAHELHQHVNSLKGDIFEIL